MYPWTKQMMDFWLKPGSGLYSGAGNFGTSSMWADPTDRMNAENPWQLPFKMAQTMCESFIDTWSGNKESSGQAANFTDMMMSLTQQGLESYVELQERWLGGLRSSGMSPGAGRHEDIMKASSVWLDAFQKLLRPFLNMPTVGLTRSYQEQFNEVVDKYYSFSATMTELVHQLNIPMEEASKKVREQAAEWAKEGKVPGGKESYDQWVKLLEQSYQELLRSPKYIELLSKTVDSYSDFVVAQQQVYGNALRNLPIATTKDLDELSKEIYTLKKKLRDVVKGMETPPSPPMDYAGPMNGN